MKKIIYACLGAWWLLVMNSCNNETIPVNKEVKSIEVKVGKNKVLHSIANFSEEIHNESLSYRNTMEELNVLSINKQTISVVLDKSTSRSADEPTNVDIYTVEFEKGKQKGFSIATDDDRIENNVFFYTENGSVRDTSFNEGLRLYISSIPYTCQSEIEENNLPKTRGGAGYIVLNMIVKDFLGLQWDQRSPFNDLAPLCSNSPDGHAPIGCGPIAVAQSVAYYGSLGLASGNWPYGDLTSKPFPISSDENEITAKFTYEIARYCGVVFDCENTLTTLTYCRYALNHYGITHTYNRGKLNEKATWEAISKKNLVIAAGHIKNKVGHIWLYTGARAYIRKDNLQFDRLNALYVNWGQRLGLDNGWVSNPRWAYYINKEGKYIENYAEGSEQIYINRLK